MKITPVAKIQLKPDGDGIGCLCLTIKKMANAARMLAVMAIVHQPKFFFVRCPSSVSDTAMPIRRTVSRTWMRFRFIVYL